ncbi:MAG: tRNA(fMet)-specific endonuclease VapC [Candidatus Methanofastidiosum methylothiophilum]|uniref:tRNA(FMet)-specific endonuclease VapC n=1 Tax=Candidatus Methanofastidiosum methylothiophilum TaxID=1705564 RepID=A0A150J0Z9_9EURY|nr:MAG: tRNA(fMet)-specific endonuclease VapC [Candidatus Methanofastidiosum methylthiophilus]KYC48263.1 MAG: tRNA(fMet)-specific endonuclease VapC [Candidatus Methanofastidiosum methylthiophilus]KYC50920.1 MAG: tRNA(fMet)-specific endonuclease VapC [Candidatus Methanofastidiosum methylthiophilus]
MSVNINLLHEDAFIDTNIFLYTIKSNNKFSSDCKGYISKVKYGEVLGYVSPLIISELFYKLIMIEISETKKLDLSKSKIYLKENPSIIPKLKKSSKVIEELYMYEGIKILQLGEEISKLSFDLSKEYGLLPNDAIHAASCKYYDIKNIATNDSDFERVDFLKVWKP